MPYCFRACGTRRRRPAVVERGCNIHPASLAVCLRSYPAGRIESPASPNPWVAIQVGPSVRVSCRGDGLSSRGVAVVGDVHVVPAGMPTSWETQGTVTSLFLRVPAMLLEQVACDAEKGAEAAGIAPCFLTRDPQIEHIGWALKAEIEAGSPNGGLFLDSLGAALASHLLVRHSSRSARFRPVSGGLPGPTLKRLLTYIEDTLDGALTLATLADVAGLSASHLKALFRQSMGMPVHQYSRAAPDRKSHDPASEWDSLIEPGRPRDRLRAPEPFGSSDAPPQGHHPDRDPQGPGLTRRRRVKIRRPCRAAGCGCRAQRWSCPSPARTTARRSGT